MKNKYHKNPRTWFLLVVCFMAIGLPFVHAQEKPTSSVEYWKEQIRANPDDVVAHYNLGVAYFMLGDKEAALDEYKILKNLDTEMAYSLFNLIEEKGGKEQAKRRRSADGRYLDDGNGVVKDIRTGLMWTKKDSWADLGKCLDWNASRRYVSALRTGGYSDWRLPIVKELKGIFERSKSNNMAYNSQYPLHLDSIFADGAAYWYWSSQIAGSCCARSVDFRRGFVSETPRATCIPGGVRAVRR